MRLILLALFTVNHIAHLLAQEEKCNRSNIIKFDESWKVYQMRILTDVMVYECCYCKKKQQCSNSDKDLLENCLKDIAAGKSNSQCNKSYGRQFTNYKATADLLSGKIVLNESTTCNYFNEFCFENNKMAVWSNESKPFKKLKETCNFKKISLTTDTYALTMRNQYLVFDVIQGLSLEIINKSRLCNKTIFLTNIKGVVLSNDTIDEWDDNFPEFNHNLTFTSKKDLLASLGPKCLYDHATLGDLDYQIDEIKKITFYILIAIVCFIALYIIITSLKLLIKCIAKIKESRGTRSETLKTNLKFKKVSKNGKHCHEYPSGAAYNINDLYGTQQ
ncbi:uncharacterized protein LOC108907747 [Anoplophora glabripennis]|uniref:uncharacterized protein LOC108907747 n=1 Tax=Anoplophora glabripennis TaxID=217634 RepID=UPI000875405D|nr:uncharacterized protein LOC108907747 [Anoplophora glabripennis]